MNTIMKVAMVLLVASPALGQDFYNLTFNTSDQPLNQLPISGAAPDYITRIVSGSPTVVASLDGLTDQPLRFQLNAPQPPFYIYDQIQLNLPRAQFLDVSFDFTSVGLIGSPLSSFRVFFDTPTVRTVTFDSGGAISAGSSLGSFADHEAFHFEIQLDLGQQHWSFYQDGNYLGTSSFVPQDYVRDIRFSFGTSAGMPDGALVGIDNVVVVIPEPRSLLLLGLFCVIGLLWRFRRAKKQIPDGRSLRWLRLFVVNQSRIELSGLTESISSMLG